MKLIVLKSYGRVYIYLRKKHLNIMPLLTYSTITAVDRDYIRFNFDRRQLEGYIWGRGLTPLPQGFDSATTQALKVALGTVPSR